MKKIALASLLALGMATTVGANELEQKVVDTQTQQEIAYESIYTGYVSVTDSVIIWYNKKETDIQGNNITKSIMRVPAFEGEVIVFTDIKGNEKGLDMIEHRDMTGSFEIKGDLNKRYSQLYEEIKSEINFNLGYVGK